jgi:hypothetical protein
MTYVASSDYIEYANITSSDHYDADDEARWAALIARSTAIIETYTGRFFEATTATGDSSAAVTRKFDALLDVDGYTLFLDRDLCAISTVTNGNAVVVSDTEYITEPRNDTPYYAIRILSSANKDWTYSGDYENAISIAGSWAYSVTPPNDIKHVCLRLTKWLEDQRKSNSETDRPLLAGEGSVIMPTRLPADVVSILDHYKKRKVVGV